MIYSFDFPVALSAFSLRNRNPGASSRVSQGQVVREVCTRNAGGTVLKATMFDYLYTVSERGGALVHLIQILAAYLLALPVGWEREKSTRIMGLRTFPLVCIASCGYVLVALALVGESADARARIIQGLMSGIGFIGGGALLKQGANVKGTATAASVWTTGAVGAAVGFGQFDIAVILSLVNFVTLRYMTPIERKLGKTDQPEEGQYDESDEDG